MESFTVYCIIVAILLLAVVFTIAFLDGQIDESTILATPNIAKGDATFTSFTNIRINASADDVWAAVLEFHNYGRWNTLVKTSTWEETTADGAPFVKSKGTIRINLKGLKEQGSRVECTLLDRERKLFSYRGISLPLFIFHAEKVQEVAPIQGEKNSCNFRIWETVGGMSGLPARYFLKDALDDGVKRTANDLKDYIENKKY